MTQNSQNAVQEGEGANTAGLLKTISLLSAENEKLRVASTVVGAASAAGAAAPQAPGTKPWITSVVQFLGIPTILVAIVVSFTQVTGNLTTTQKTDAEAYKFRTEAQLNEVNLKKALTDLEASKTKGYEEARAELNRTLPVIIESTKRLQELNALTTRTQIDLNIARFIVLWILYQAVSLIFGIIHELWNPVVNGLSMGLQNWIQIRRRRAWDKNRKQEIQRLERLQYITPWINLVLWPIPSVLQWALQLLIFTALMIPLFNEMASSMGSPLSFDAIWAHAKNFELSQALVSIKQILKLN